MKILYIFYILIIILTKTEWVILREENFDDVELTHLAQKLNPMECLRLLEAMNIKRPMTNEEYVKTVTKISLDDESILRRQLEMPFFNRDNCRIKLQEWSRKLPEKSNMWARMAMENALRTLGRPDLAKYVRRNRRVARYFNEISRISRNAARGIGVTKSIISEPIRITSSAKIYQDPPKEAVIQYYRAEQAGKATGNSNFARGRVMGAHNGGDKSDDADDSTTRWTAFLILLILIVLTILSTVLFALYKKNRGSIFSNVNKCSSDCPYSSRNKPSSTEVDIEQGERTPTSSRCVRRRDRRSSIQQQKPSSTCLGQEIPQLRKPKRKKSLKVKPQRLVSQGQRMVEKRPRRKCERKCTGVENDVAKMEKSTKTRQRKTSEKMNKFECPQKPRIDLKKFHAKIANILRRDNPPCKCCECSLFSGDEKYESGNKWINGKKNICDDEACQKRKLKSIAELCLSPDETSPTEEPQLEMNKKPKEKRKKKKKKEKDPDKEKESEKSSLENSPRSKGREGKNKKSAKAKKEKYNVEEACTIKTCNVRRSTADEIFNVDRE